MKTLLALSAIAIISIAPKAFAVENEPELKDRYDAGGSYSSCVEGDIQRFLEDDGTDNASWNYYVCEDGRYVPMYSNGNSRRHHRGHRKACREGQTERFLIDNGTDSAHWETYTCRNGRMRRSH